MRCPKCKHRLQHICSVNGPLFLFKGWKAKPKRNPKPYFDVTEPLPKPKMPKPKIKTVGKVNLFYCNNCLAFIEVFNCAKGDSN